MELNLVMLGPPGAGKGTQARQLRRKWDIPHISTGAMLREAVAAGTPLGRAVAGIMESGGLINDELITRVVTERLAQPDTKVGFLLDGFPRTIPQAESLDRIVSDRAPLIIIDIILTEAEVIRRLASRMVCSECGANAVGEGSRCIDCGGPLVPRADDREQVVLNRLKVYREQTEPLVEYYGKRPTYCRIDGARLPDDVTEEIITAVESQT
ncbi:MAG: adenylate kinase [Acidobacteria bacterium]|nr:MAG: adenylate kinase [Acidobacteriota bacterium]PYR73650.1 MAG: adenylate kinase [Acidobacteriota bacterium]